jgi:hypothetical protein
MLGYAMLVPAPIDYSARGPGIDNRANCFAAVGMVITGYAWWVLVVTLATSLHGVLATTEGSGRTRQTLIAAVAAAVLLGYVVRLEAHGRKWDEAAAEQRRAIAGMRRLVPVPPTPDTTLYVFGAPAYTALSIPIFAGGGTMDLFSAVKVLFDEPALGAFPVTAEAHVRCTRTGMEYEAVNPPSAPPYGKVVLVDLTNDRVWTPADRAACVRVLDTIPRRPTLMDGTSDFGSDNASLG